VRSIVDRFLEHSRFYYFENACQPKVFIASADWLPRNFFRRVELVVPIEDGNLRERIIKEVLSTCLADNLKARFLQPDGSYARRPPAKGRKSRHSQAEFIALAEADENPGRNRADGKTAYPKVKLNPSPFAVAKRRT
jgi:polyphosphate kinase